MNVLVVVERSGPASASKLNCCGCFHRKKRASLVLSDIYTHPCSVHGNCAERSPLGPPDDACSVPSNISNIMKECDYEAGHEKATNKKTRKKHLKVSYEEFEFAADAISLNNKTAEERPSNNRGSTKSLNIENPYVTVNGKEELPCVQEIKDYNAPKTMQDNNLLKTDNLGNRNEERASKFDRNCNRLALRKIYSYCTLPKRKTGTDGYRKSCFISPPKRVTPDGTHIYYWCDLQKKCGGGKQVC